MDLRLNMKWVLLVEHILIRIHIYPTLETSLLGIKDPYKNHINDIFMTKYLFLEYFKYI